MFYSRVPKFSLFFNLESSSFCEILNLSQSHQPDTEEPASVVIELVGEGKNISKCKSCLVKNEIISAENLDANLLALCEKEEKPLVSHNGHYLLENLVDNFSCVAHGLIGKIRPESFKVKGKV